MLVFLIRGFPEINIYLIDTINQFSHFTLGSVNAFKLLFNLTQLSRLFLQILFPQLKFTIDIFNLVIQLSDLLFLNPNEIRVNFKINVR